MGAAAQATDPAAQETDPAAKPVDQIVPEAVEENADEASAQSEDVPESQLANEQSGDNSQTQPEDIPNIGSYNGPTYNPYPIYPVPPNNVNYPNYFNGPMPQYPSNYPIPQNIQPPAVQHIPQNAFHQAPQNIPQVFPTQDTPQHVSNFIPQYAPQNIPQHILHNAPLHAQQHVVQNIPQNIPQQVLQTVPQHILHNTPPNVPQYVPQIIPQNYAQNIPPPHPQVVSNPSQAFPQNVPIGFAPQYPYNPHGNARYPQYVQENRLADHVHPSDYDSYSDDNSDEALENETPSIKMRTTDVAKEDDPAIAIQNDHVNCVGTDVCNEDNLHTR